MVMDRLQISTRLRSVIAELCDEMNTDAICADHQLQLHLGFDSMERFELLMEIEDEFQIVFPDQADETRLTQPDTTVEQLLQAVEQQLAKKGIAA